MRKLLIGVALLMSSCRLDPEVAQTVLEPLTSRSAKEALDEAGLDATMLKVWAVCGPSSGKGLYSGDSAMKFEDDGISEGRLIFVSGADGSGSNLFYRDANGGFTSSLEDGASVQVLWKDDTSSASVWVVKYEQTGVIETHNLFFANNDLFDLWTSNKPLTLLGSPSARVFQSRCAKP